MNYPNKVVKEGEKDKTIVKAIQKRLAELGLGSFGTSGVFGPKTKVSVKEFQGTHRDSFGNPLEMDGKIGAITWAALFGEPKAILPGKATGSFLAEAVRVAISQVGVMEQPPGSNKGPEVNQYLASVNCPPGLFWCAGFVYWTFNKAAGNLSIANSVFKTAGCLAHWVNTKGKKIPAADATANPSLLSPGQIFIIDHGGGNGHTGIIEKVENGFIHTIEGNSNPSGSSNGIGVFQLVRKINKINKGFIDYS